MTARTPQEIAKLFGCTPEQVRSGYARNAAQLAQMAIRAQRTGTYRGFTAARLAEAADRYAALAKVQA